MPDKRSYNAHFKNKHGDVQFTNILLVLFEEDGSHIAFAPALDLTGYGDTDEEATASFEIVLKNFLDYTTKKQTLVSELKRLGWHFNGKNFELVKSPSFDDLIDTNQALAKLVEERTPMRTMKKAVQLFANA